MYKNLLGQLVLIINWIGKFDPLQVDKVTNPTLPEKAAAKLNFD